MKLLLIKISSLLLLFTVAPTSWAQSNIPPNYELVWSDEFDGTALDMTKWGHRQLHQQRRDAFNSDETVHVVDGNLELSTQLDSGVYKTAMISTQGRYETTYGYFETRVLFQDEVGHWSAFWLQSPNVSENENDSIGKEIDIFEYLPNKKKKVQHALHRGTGEDLESKAFVIKNKKLKEGWHTFGLLWTKEAYVFYIDGEVSWITQSPKVSQNRKYIILSLEVGEWAGKIQKADLPDKLLVDYVRVYQPKAITK